MTTRYQPRTDVERWQIQDRLALRLRQIQCPGQARFFQASIGRLAFRIWTLWRPPAALLQALQTIDEPAAHPGA